MNTQPTDPGAVLMRRDGLAQFVSPRWTYRPGETSTAYLRRYQMMTNAEFDRLMAQFAEAKRGNDE